MRPFAYARACDTAAAIDAITPDAMFLAGGTNLLDLIKEGVARPSTLVDVTRVDLSGIMIEPDGTLVIGALSKNSDTANDPQVRQRHPLLSQAILAGASPQIRNMATMGGNINQRTRCPYFYEPALPCNKRAPGTGCAALDGINRNHAIFGWSDSCVATHPSDMCVALTALDATVEVLGPKNRHREIGFGDYHRIPGDAPECDNTLQPSEIVTSVRVPLSGLADHSCYLKVRERSSYAFALVSVAAALELRDGVIVDVRLAMGGVAHRPWRATAAEGLLAGRVPSPELFGDAAAAEMATARPLSHNGYKVALGERLIVRALETALRGTSSIVG